MSALPTLGSGEHWDAQLRTRAAGGSGRPEAAPWQHQQGAQSQDRVLWLEAISSVPEQLSGHLTGQVAPSECQHRVKATEGQGP